MMESKLLKNIIKSTNDIRKKYKAIKHGKIDKEILLEETFKPISKPLYEIKEKTEKGINEIVKPELKKNDLSSTDQSINNEDITNESTHHYSKFFRRSPFSAKTLLKTPDKDVTTNQLSTFQSTPKTRSKKSTNNKNVNQSLSIFQESQNKDPTVSKAKLNESYNKNVNQSSSDKNALGDYYTREYWNNSRNLDKAFGPKYSDYSKQFKIGAHYIKFKQNTIDFGGNEYPATQGLYELIFMKNPTDYSPSDLDNYKAILLKSNVYRLAANSNNRIKGNSSEKYKKIISKIIAEKSGEGLMLVNTQRPNYIYWDDPNELVERLQLLIASQQAGHSNHNNEIISIIEELREANIIV